MFEGDVVTRGADPKTNKGMAWTVSLRSRLQLFMAEPSGVNITLNGEQIIPLACEQLLGMLVRHTHCDAHVHTHIASEGRTTVYSMCIVPTTHGNIVLFW